MNQYTMQEKIFRALSSGEWATVEQVAERVGCKPNSTIRCILHTLAFCGLVTCEWARPNSQYQIFYRWTKGE